MPEHDEFNAPNTAEEIDEMLNSNFTYDADYCKYLAKNMTMAADYLADPANEMKSAAAIKRVDGIIDRMATNSGAIDDSFWTCLKENLSSLNDKKYKMNELPGQTHRFT